MLTKPEQIDPEVWELIEQLSRPVKVVPVDLELDELFSTNWRVWVWGILHGAKILANKGCATVE